VPTNGFFVIAKQIGDISNRHAALQQDSREGVTETLGVWGSGRVTIAHDSICLYSASGS
jgi:hypothetical protein